MNFELNEQQLSIQKMARDFTEKKVAPKVLERDETREYDVNLYKDLCDMGFIGLPYAKEYGGQGLGYMEYALAVEEISKVDPSLGVSFSVATSLYGGSLYFSEATDEQLKRFMPPVLRDGHLGSFGLTEPTAGSDVSGMLTFAQRDGDEYIINGSKCFITNGPLSDYFCVYALTDHELGPKSIATFVVERNTPGFTIGARHNTMGIRSAMGLFAIDGSPEFISAMFTIIPIALATMMEHVGDIAAISATVGHNYINDPGLNRTLMGDGLATAMAGLLGGPANTTYGENTGVLALSRIYDPLVIRIAAVMAVILSFSPKFEAVINTIPTGIIGGISFVLYGMISAIGVRNVVENRVDFTNSRNLIVAAVILVCALGFNSVGGLTFAVGGVSINLSGLAIAAIVGILLNAILPGNDYEFDAANGSDAPSSGNLQV